MLTGALGDISPEAPPTSVVDFEIGVVLKTGLETTFKGLGLVSEALFIFFVTLGLL